MTEGNLFGIISYKNATTFEISFYLLLFSLSGYMLFFRSFSQTEKYILGVMFIASLLMIFQTLNRWKELEKPQKPTYVIYVPEDRINFKGDKREFPYIDDLLNKGKDEKKIK